MKWTVPLVIVVMALVFLAVPSASADSVNSIELGDVTVMTIEGEITVDSRDVHTLNVNIHNNGSQPVSVRLYYSSNDIVLIMSSDVIVDSGKTSVVVVQVIPDDYLSAGTYEVPIQVITYTEGTQSTGTLPLTVHLMSVYSCNEEYNKVMGIFSLPSPYDVLALSIVCTILCWVAIAAVGSLISALFIHIIYKFRSEGKSTERTSMIHFFLFIMMFAIPNAVRVAGVSEDIVASVDRIVSLGIIVFGAFIIWTFYKAVVFHVMYKIDEKSDIEGATVVPMMNLLGEVVIIAVAAAAILSKLGVDPVGIIAGAGVASRGVSLGAKPVINEFFSGLVLLMTRPFVKGDRIKINGGETLVIEKVKIMLTELVTNYTQETITVPNSTLASSVITNITWNGERYRHTVKIRVPYDCDIELAKRLIKEAALEIPGIVRGDKELHDPVVIVSETKDHGNVVLTLAYYSSEYANTWDWLGLIYEHILKKFSENGLRVPPDQKRYNILSGGEVSDAQ